MANPAFNLKSTTPWIASPAIRYHLGVDGISLWLVVLTGFLAPLGVLASWKAINHRTKEFYFFFLLQQTAMIGVFVALDMFLYYAFWELTLVPMAILISMFGRDRGTEAAIKFFVYTFLPSALLLVAIVWLYAKTGTFDFVRLQSILAQDTVTSRPRRSSGPRWHFWSPSPSRSRSFRCMAGWAMSSAKRPRRWPWWSPASWASIPSCASISASSLPRRARSRRG